MSTHPAALSSSTSGTPGASVRAARPLAWFLLGASMAALVVPAAPDALATPVRWSISTLGLTAAALLLWLTRRSPLPEAAPEPEAAREAGAATEPAAEPEVAAQPEVAPEVAAEPVSFARAPVLAHEIRNPLTAAVGRLDLLMDDPKLSTEQRASLGTALRGVERASALISDFLTDPEGWEPGRVRFDRNPVDLTALLSEAMQEYAPLAHERQIAISLDAAPSVRVPGDSRRLRQVVDNLLSNAVKYNETGGWVDIRLWVADAGSDAESGTEGSMTAEMEMTNPGTTVAVEEQADVFDERFRGTEAHHKAPGLGLGLSVVHEVVIAHQGIVTLTSDNVAQTTRIRLSLPFWSTV